MSLNRSWSREAIMALINVYERNSYLYDTPSPDYHNRKFNRNVLDEMVHVVAQFHPDVTAEDCRKKYQGLRNQFLSECRKLADSKKSGAGTSNIYTPKLWCSQALNFLRSFVKVRASTFVGDREDPTVKNLEEEMTVECLDEVFEDSEYSELAAPSPSTQLESCTSVGTRKFERSTSAPASVSAAAEKRSVPSPVPGCSTERPVTPLQKKRKNYDARGSCSREDTPTRESTPTGRGRSDSTFAIASALDKIANKSTSQDDYDVFGNVVASRLNQLGKNYSEDVVHDIVHIIFAAEKRKKYNS